ncbi:MAG: hypothetical protein AABX40_01325 [Candidatus Hydrothermarchaeota archaeon]
MVSRSAYFRLPYIIIFFAALLLVIRGSVLRGIILLVFLIFWTPQFDRAMERLHLPSGDWAKYLLMFLLLVLWLLYLRPMGS